MYRSKENNEMEVLLVHPGGPFWKNKDAGSWTIPKGEVSDGEDELQAAIREFKEETGIKPEEPFFSLGEVKQKSGKIVKAWAFKGDCDPANIKSNTFSIEWPPKSGKMTEFPEIDRAEFFGIDEAVIKINPAQISFIEKLVSSSK